MSNITIRSKAPLRLGLAGGGTDVSPFCDQFGGAILNITIDRYAYVTLKTRDDNKIFFEAADLNLTDTLNQTSQIPLDEGLILHRAVYNRFVKDYNDNKPLPISVHSFVESPMGSGLGSSSALVVAMVEAYKEFLNIPLGEYDVAALAYSIEREDAGQKGGRQDQFAATFGGVNFMEFHANNRTIVNPLRLRSTILSELEASMVLFFTGVSRHSSKIIEDQIQSVSNETDNQLVAMQQLKQDAFDMKEAILFGDIRKLSQVLNQSWQAKKQTSSAISNSFLDEIYTEAIENGALAGKISGAGGGGFMMFIVDPLKRAQLIQYLSQKNGNVENCKFESTGSLSWRVS